MNFDDISPEQEKNIREKLNSWAVKSELPVEKSLQLEQIVRDLATKEKRIQRLKIVGSLAAAAVILIMFIITLPGTRSWAVENLPVVGRYIANWSSLEKGWQWAEEHEMFQEIITAKTDKGYTFRVHRILAGPTQTTIIYTVEGKNPANIKLGKHDILFNGRSLAYSYSKRGHIIDGVFVGSIELSDGLPEEKGTLKLPVRQIGNVKGNWVVSFPVTRVALTELTRIVPVNEKIAIPNGILTIEELVLVPTQTVVKLRYKGEERAPELTTYEGVKLKTPGGTVKPRGGGASGTWVGDSWEQTYELVFQRLDPVPQEVTLELTGMVYQKGETRIPLNSKQLTYVPDGRQLLIMDLQQDGRKGEATISYLTDKENSWPFSNSDWQVLDEQGKMHSITETTGEGTDKEYKLKLSWELPPGNNAVALINPGYWEYRDNLGSFIIKIPKD